MTQLLTLTATQKFPLQASEDIGQLRRLGPGLNLTVHDDNNNNNKVVDVRLHVASDKSVINIRYGVEPRDGNL